MSPSALLDILSPSTSAARGRILLLAAYARLDILSPSTSAARGRILLLAASACFIARHASKARPRAERI